VRGAVRFACASRKAGERSGGAALRPTGVLTASASSPLGGAGGFDGALAVPRRAAVADGTDSDGDAAVDFDAGGVRRTGGAVASCCDKLRNCSSVSRSLGMAAAAAAGAGDGGETGDDAAVRDSGSCSQGRDTLADVDEGATGAGAALAACGAGGGGLAGAASLREKSRTTFAPLRKCRRRTPSAICRVKVVAPPLWVTVTPAAMRARSRRICASSSVAA